MWCDGRINCMLHQDDIRLFAAVVREGGFSLAARQMGLTRSAVSRRIDQMETRLGVRLITRTTRRFALTTAGKILFEHCARIAQDIDAAEQAIREDFGAPRGDLRVNCAVMIGLKLIIPRLKGFARAYPGMRVHIDLSDAPLLRGDTHYDLHIRLGEADDPALVARRLARSRRILCAAPAYLAEFGRPASVEDLARHACLLISGLGVDSNTWLFRDGGRVEKRRVRGSLVFNSGDGHYEALVAGLGIGRVTEILARADIAAQRLIPVLEHRHAGDPEPILALYQGGKHTPQKTRAFVDYFRRSLRDVVPV